MDKPLSGGRRERGNGHNSIPDGLCRWNWKQTQKAVEDGAHMKPGGQGVTGQFFLAPLPHTQEPFVTGSQELCDEELCDADLGPVTNSQREL